MDTTEVQKEILKDGCPNCGSKEMYASFHEGTFEEDEGEMYVHCESCEVNVDSGGSYIAP
jgi:formate dehydrogenase maturation protein FdhE